MDTTNIQLSAKMRGLSKGQFLKTEAATGVKMAALISLIIFVVIAALIIAATVVTNSTSVLELPAVSMLMDSRDKKEVKAELKEALVNLEEAEDRLEYVEEVYGTKVAKAAKDLVKKAKAAQKTVSVNNVNAMAKSFEKLEKVADEDLLEELNTDSLGDDYESVIKACKIVRTGTFVFAAIVILLVMWSALGNISGLSVFCIFLYIPYCALLSNVALALVIGAALIALAVTTSKVTRAWKAMRYTA